MTNLAERLGTGPDVAVSAGQVPHAPGALELADEGLNVLFAQLDRLEHRLAHVLASAPPTDPADSAIAHLTSLHATAARIHAAARTLGDITDRIAI